MDSEEIARAIQANKDLSERNQARIEKLEKGQLEIKDLTNSVFEMVSEQKHMNKELAEVKDDVKFLKEKPSKRWDNMVNQVLTLIIAAIVAWMLGQIGL